MQLALRDMTSLVGGMKAAVRAAATAAVNLTPGSAMTAILEATATLGIYFQWLTLQVLTQTRLATTVGADVDSWVLDYGLTRLPGVAAVGAATFSRFSPTNAALIVPGALTLTTGGATQFVVTTDITQPTWNGTGYVIAAGVASLTVPVAAVIAGTLGNVAAGGISLLGSAISGVDTVTNALPLTGGLNAETDAALKARFVLYINSRSLATVGAILAAVASYQQGLTATVLENVPQAGFFTVIVDDGSGHPSTAVLLGVLAAVNLVRPVGTVASVQGPAVVNVSIGVTLALSASASRSVVIGEVSSAVAAYVASLPVGVALSYGKLGSIVYGADTAILPGTSILLNGGSVDVPATATQVVRVSALSVA